jgi:predicted RNA-binding protein with PIN domain
MQYLIDGHNLIPYVPGISLEEMDDEESLVRILQIHARVSRSKLEVFFDKAPAGRAGIRKVGMITVHSISTTSIADTAIIARVRSMKKGASSWTVVSSDNRLKTECRRLGAKVVESAEFSKMVQKSLNTEQQKEKEQPVVDPGDIEEWLDVFGGGKPKGKDQD